MEARYFRYLFENVSGGIMQCGYIEDTRIGEKTFYVYMSENNIQKINSKVCNSVFDSFDRLPDEDIDILILGEFRLFYIMGMLELLKRHKVHAIVLPYIMPDRRRMLTHTIPFPKSVMQFLNDPYNTLMQMGVGNIHFVYGNGRNIAENLDKMPDGVYFEKADENVLEAVKCAEGKYIPIEKAGYIVKNGWLFYFGAYGFEMEKNQHLIRNVHQGKSIPLIQATIAMFAGPIEDSPKLVDSSFTEKTFSKVLKCMPGKKNDNHVCDMRCMRFQDHSVMKRHTDRERGISCFGVLLLGNLSLRVYMEDFAKRFHSIRNRVRVVTIPDGGNQGRWNSRILNMFTGADYRFWLVSMNRSSSGEVLKEIMESSSYNRLVNVNEEFGSCFSGYLVDRNEFY